MGAMNCKDEDAGEAGRFVLHHFSQPSGLIRTSDYYIYLLRDPRDKSVRYVGRTIDPERRYRRHLFDRCRGSYVRARWEWITELRSIKLRPEIEIIETLSAPIPEAAISEREFRWIFHFFQQGANLTNVDCIRMPRLYSAARRSRIDFLNQPLHSRVWKKLASLAAEDNEEWRAINRRLDNSKKSRTYIAHRNIR
jgi:hypothetical protein